MNDFLKYIQSQPGFMAMKPVDDDEIQKAECALNVTFAKDYAEYVKACGAATFDCYEMTGICASKRLNVVDVTLKQRQIDPNVPERLYVVEECGIDGACMWQDADGSVYCIVPGNAPQRVADNLLDYVEE